MIERYGTAAVMGSGILSIREMRQMSAAERTWRAFENRKSAMANPDYGAAKWAADHPRENSLLAAAEELNDE